MVANTIVTNPIGNRAANFKLEDSHITCLTLMTKNLYTFQTDTTSYLTTDESQDAFRNQLGDCNSLLIRIQKGMNIHSMS
jgi:hypothetical protein